MQPTQAATQTTVAASRGRLPALLKASIACHLGAGAAVVAAPALWPWALGAVAIDHALIAGSGLWPRSTWLGENMRRLPDASAARREISITIDDGPDPKVTPRVLDVLDAFNARATFFCIATHAQQHPALCSEIVARGHSVQNHSHRHSHNFSVLGPSAIRREIEAAQDTLAQITGVRPRYFRAPAGLRNLFLAPVLQALDMQLVSWTRRGFDTVRSDPAFVLSKLAKTLAAGDILLLHDHNTATAPSGKPVVMEVLPQLLDAIARAQLRTVTLPEAAIA
jgi:peptidoglycan-N-acetylglucosamine deacetylase